MSEPPIQPSPSAQADAAPLTRSEKLFLRISIWQTVLSVAAVFTGVIALYAALTESAAVRRQTAASVWPYVQIAVNDYVGPEDAAFELTMTNTGVGPAQVRAMRVTLNGDARTSWREVVDAVGGGGEAPFAQDFVLNRVLSPGETVQLFSIADPAAVPAIQAAVSDPETAIELCYCSIFDECWLADSRAPGAQRETVRACPDYGADLFSN